MRVIAGTARSMPLRCIEGLDTRPTTDRIKETLFNMLQREIPGCRFLDLFGGSGAIGIEALSRGADFAAFAEDDRFVAGFFDNNVCVDVPDFCERVKFHFVYGNAYAVMNFVVAKHHNFFAYDFSHQKALRLVGNVIVVEILDVVAKILFKAFFKQGYVFVFS